MNKNGNINKVFDNQQYMVAGSNPSNHTPIIINQPSKPFIRPKGSLFIAVIFTLVLSTTVIIYFTLGEAFEKFLVTGSFQIKRSHLNRTNDNRTRLTSRDDTGNLNFLYFNQRTDML